MNFSLQRHARIAGSVAVVVGVWIANWPVVLFGWTIVAVSYMIAVSKIESYIERQELEDREGGDNAIH